MRPTSQGDILEDGDIVANAGCLPYDNAVAVIHEDALSKLGLWVYVH